MKERLGFSSYKRNKEGGMRITFMRQRKGRQMEAVRGADEVGFLDAVRRVFLLLKGSATNLARTGQVDLTLYFYDTVTDEPVCDVYHRFFGADLNYLLTVLLYRELYYGMRKINLTGIEEGFLDDYMPRLLNNLEMDSESKLKAVAAVLYGGAVRRDDVERLVKLDWKDFIAAIRIAQSEGIGAVEVLDMIKQPVAA
jgi:hypothetical protein